MSHQGPPPEPGLAVQKQRQRRYHQRSRNGCLTCKKRHVRCDEARPLCMNCLRTGGECGFSDPFVSFAGSSAEAVPKAEAHPASRLGQIIKSKPPSICGTASPQMQVVPASQSLLDMTPKDMLSGIKLPGSLSKLPAKSRWLFHTFAERSIQPRAGVQGLKESFLVQRALSDPGMLHVCLSLSAVQWLWSTGDWKTVKVPLQFHKIEAYKYVRQQIEKPGKIEGDTTINTVASIALLEAALWQTHGGPAAGSIQNIITHLHGLRKIIELHLKPQGSALNLFQRTVKMGTSCMLDGIVVNDESIAKEVTTDTYQPLIPSVLFMGLWPNPLDGWWESADGMNPKAKAWFATERSPGQDSFRDFEEVPTDPSEFGHFLVASRNAYFTCFLYMVMMLREGALNSFVLSLLIDQMLDDAERSKPAVLAGKSNATLWFWTMVVALAAVDSAPAENRLEEMQIQAWRKAVKENVRLGNTILDIHDWETARVHLRAVAWADGFDGEEEIRQMWEDATFGEGPPMLEGNENVPLVLRSSPRPREIGLLTPRSIDD